MAVDISPDGMKMYAYIQKNPYENNSYFIFVNKDIDISINEVLSHELTHLKQMQNGRLIQNNINYAIFLGDTINFSKIPYDHRLYEIEAFNNEKSILRSVNQILYP